MLMTTKVILCIIQWYYSTIHWQAQHAYRMYVNDSKMVPTIYTQKACPQDIASSYRSLGATLGFSKLFPPNHLLFYSFILRY